MLPTLALIPPAVGGISLPVFRGGNQGTDGVLFPAGASLGHLFISGHLHRAAAMSLVACECPPGPGLEPEPCSRARSQARVYLEQIRNLVAPGAPDMTKRDYLVDAATQIRLALERDVSEDYEAAFNHYQNGVDVLLRGVHGEHRLAGGGGSCWGRASLGLAQSSVHLRRVSRAPGWPRRASGTVIIGGLCERFLYARHWSQGLLHSNGDDHVRC